MDEQTVEKITESMKRMAEVAEALQQTLMHISAQQEEISAKVEKIVAAIEENYEVRSSKDEVRAPLPMNVLGRKTLSPLVTMILAKNGVEDGSDTGMLDKALSTLSPEQRIAVKSEMARAGIIQ